MKRRSEWPRRSDARPQLRRNERPKKRSDARRLKLFTKEISFRLKEFSNFEMEVSKKVEYHRFLGVGRISNREKRVFQVPKRFSIIFHLMKLMLGQKKMVLNFGDSESGL